MRGHFHAEKRGLFERKIQAVPILFTIIGSLGIFHSAILTQTYIRLHLLLVLLIYAIQIRADRLIISLRL